MAKPPPAHPGTNHINRPSACAPVRGLVVGRFQPFHNGHLALIRSAGEQCLELTVGIGSATAKPSLRNPFSFDERKRMVEAALGAARLQARVLAIPDLHDPPRWAAHVAAIVGPVDKVFGNDDETLSLFELAGVPVVRTGLVERERHEARLVRAQLAEDDPSWRRAVPPAVAQLLDQWEAGRRLRGMEAMA